METISKCIYYCVYSVIINTLSLLMRIYQLSLLLHAKFKYLIYGHIHQLLGGEQFQYEHTMTRINNSCTGVPCHLALIIDINSANITKITDFLTWSLMVGIKRVTIFERTGLLKKQIDNLQNDFENRKLSFNRDYIYTWLNKSNQSSPDIAGTDNSSLSNSKKFEIAIVSNEDGKMQLVNITRKYTVDRKSDPTLKLDSNYIQSNMPTHLGGDGNEPEIAIDFTESTILNSFLPWHVKLTEFIKIDNFNQLYLDKFIDILEKYGRIEKRLGK